jgi:hypothetical protein
MQITKIDGTVHAPTAKRIAGMAVKTPINVYAKQINISIPYQINGTQELYCDGPPQKTSGLKTTSYPLSHALNPPKKSRKDTESSGVKIIDH